MLGFIGKLIGGAATATMEMGEVAAVTAPIAAETAAAAGTAAAVGVEAGVGLAQAGVAGMLTEAAGAANLATAGTILEILPTAGETIAIAGEVASKESFSLVPKILGIPEGVSPVITVEGLVPSAPVAAGEVASATAKKALPFAGAFSPAPEILPNGPSTETPKVENPSGETIDLDPKDWKVSEPIKTDTISEPNTVEPKQTTNTMPQEDRPSEDQKPPIIDKSESNQKPQEKVEEAEKKDDGLNDEDDQIQDEKKKY